MINITCVIISSLVNSHNHKHENITIQMQFWRFVSYAPLVSKSAPSHAVNVIYGQLFIISY